MNEDQMKCICCNKEQEVLVSVEIKPASIFMYKRGVCQKCLKIENINKVCAEFKIRETKKSINEMENSLGSMKDQLKDLQDVNCVENES